jgi:hypothetical protein
LTKIKEDLIKEKANQEALLNDYLELITQNSM